jgi:hypothetical protein
MSRTAKYRVSVVNVLSVAVGSSHLGLFAAVIAAGFAVGVFGHIIHSRPLILIGILVVGLTSAYYVFLLQPGAS